MYKHFTLNPCTLALINRSYSLSLDISWSKNECDLSVHSYIGSIHLYKDTLVLICSLGYSGRPKFS